MDPLVSVVMPYRDRGATLVEAIAGVLAEPLPLELVAVDDGSTDGGPAIVERVAAADPRVVRIATGGVGVARAMAAGVAASRAPFVARMDADDVSIPGRIAAAIDLLRADATLGAVGTRVEAFPSDVVSAGLARYVAWQNALVTPREHARDLFVEAPLCHPSVTMRRDALERAGGYVDVPWAEDYDLWMRLDAAGFGLAKTPMLGLRWRHHARRMTFHHPIVARHQFTSAKAHHLAPRLARFDRPLCVWGAGKTGKRLARALEAHGVRADHFIDIDPLKIGSVARGAPIVDPSSLVRGRHTVLVAVGARGARAIIRGRLDALGFEEEIDYVCAA